MMLQVPTGNQKTATTTRMKSRGLIAEAARKLFDERGWDGVTREDIAKEAGVALTTFRRNVATKRNAALVAYAPLLRPIVSSVIVADQEVQEVVTNFIRDLAYAAANHRAMTVVLLSARPGTQAGVALPYADEADVVDFERLVQCFDLLLEVFWGERREPVSNTKEFAEFYLFSLLSRTLKYPYDSDGAAEFLINQL